MDHSKIYCEPRSFKLAFNEGAPAQIEEINAEILDAVQKYSIKAIFAYTKAGRGVTFEELAQNGMNDVLPTSEKEVVKELTFDFEDDKLFVLQTHTMTPLARMKLTVAYSLKEEEFISFDPKSVPADDYTSSVFIKVKEDKVAVI